VAETKSSYREQMHSHARVVYNSFWFRGAGIGLATPFLLHFVAKTKSSKFWSPAEVNHATAEGSPKKLCALRVSATLR